VVALGSRVSVLAVVVARIGDTLLVTPALRALKQASGRLTVLAHPKRLEVLRNLSFIDDLGGITKNTAWLKALNSPRYNLAVCYGREPALFRYCTRVADHVIAFDYPELRGFSEKTVTWVPVPPESSMHAVDERFLLMEAAGVSVGDRRLAYVVTSGERDLADQWLAQHVRVGDDLLIGLHPFSFPTKSHRDWPLENFLELAVRIVGQYPASHILLLGDASAAKRVGVLKGTLQERCTIVAGMLTLRQNAAVLERVSLYVGVDTGPTHIAGALGVPMVVLYHPAYPGRNLMPIGHPRCIALERSATMTRDFAGDEMKLITVDQVWNAVRRVMDA
jgi:lipopolysaccharide heptosyltransferase III